MTVAGLIAVLTAFFKFPDAVVRLVGVLSKTPEEKHEELVNAIAQEMVKFQDTGRPTW